MVKFIPETHQYFLGNQELISVTTLIGLYKNKFDSDYWSSYKAVQHIVGDRDFKSLLRIKNRKSEDFQNFIEGLVDSKKLKTVKTRILAQWAEKNKKALEKGTNYHNFREEQSISQGREYNVFIDEWFYIENEEYYPEKLIWNSKAGVAGTVDKLFKRGKDVWIDDYKTNEKLKTNNPYDNMLYPLNDLEDCEYNHYMLQTGLYAWMLEQSGMNIKGIAFTHVTEFEDKFYSFDYSTVRKYIIKMLNHFKKNEKEIKNKLDVH